MDLLVTVHGSHLYGLNHAGSDVDTVIIRDSIAQEVGRRKKKAIVTHGEENDLSIFSLSSMMYLANKGIPRMLEVMFSPVATVDYLREMRLGYHAGEASLIEGYTFSLQSFNRFQFKRRRHMLREALNLNEALETNGRFNPRLSEKDAALISKIAMSPDFIQQLKSMVPVAIELPEEAIYNAMREEGIIQ